MRGNPLPLRRSLRVRVTAAATTAFVGLAAVVCLLLPHAYARQARERFHEEATGLARGIETGLMRTPGAGSALPVDEMPAWAVAHPDLDAVLLLDAAGAEIARWPENALPWKGGVPVIGLFSDLTHVVAFRPLELPGATPGALAVRLSRERLVQELDSVRWLFFSIFLFIAGAFGVLTRYLADSILEPLDQIGRAAVSLADGDPLVEMPRTGDREIDELGDFILRLGSDRPKSRGKTVPMERIPERAAEAAAETAGVVSAAAGSPRPDTS